MRFQEWEAAIAAGATLDELYKIETNQYPTWFRARIVAWYNLHNLVNMHKQDAADEAAEKKAKRKG